MNNIIEVSSNFQLDGECTSAEIHNSGHIHTTYLLHTNGSNSGPNYILQQVNQHVFPQPEQLTANIQLVSNHVRQKAIDRGRDPSRTALTMIPTRDGKLIYQDSEGRIWRLFDFIAGTCTYEAVENDQQVFQAGFAMGDFLGLLADFPAKDLYETIPNFHHTPSRFTAFTETLAHDLLGRRQEVVPEIDFVLTRQSEMSKLVNMLQDQQLPLRVTHNDTKISNVLFDQKTGEAVCMIDLDTVMPGSALYDFGDAARTMTNTAAEDEPDLSRVDFNLEYFEQLTRGFIRGASDILTEQELALLPFSAILMTLECGMRFLEDYLKGDIYFHTSRGNHNLDRARVQFRLVEKMEERLNLMNGVVKSLE
jgi:Ser/Thr protein kinase RdoA (MazF antagonist)